MKILKILAIVVFVLFDLTSCGTLKDDEMAYRDLDVDSLTISIVAKQQIVADKIKHIDSLSNHTRHLSSMAQPLDSMKSIYLVKVSEDNGSNLVTYFNFLVDLKTLSVINPDGKATGQ